MNKQATRPAGGLSPAWGEAFIIEDKFGTYKFFWVDPPFFWAWHRVCYFSRA